MMEKIILKSKDDVSISTVIHNPQTNSKGCIVLCHGITVDKDENGKFVSMADMLCSSGFRVVRFDFRGHGESLCSSEKMTITGELKDLESVAAHSLKKHKNIGLLCVSFGAGAGIRYTILNQSKVISLVLWNPVLDYEKTFLKPILPWGKSFFNSEGYRSLNEKGYIPLPDTNFNIGKDLVEEFKSIAPYKELSSVKCPTLTIHGTADTKVPYEISKEYGVPNPSSEFISVDAKHGFGDEKEFVYNKTLKWFKKTMGY